MTVSESNVPGQESSLQDRSPGNSFAGNGHPGGMLSMDFSAPLTEQARAERIKQMSKNHVAFEKTRAVQQILFKVQTSLRRMPGVSASESDEIAASLKEVAQLVSQETSQLVDAIMHLTLDGEETDKAIARMSIEASLAKAAFEDKTQQIRDLEGKLEEELEVRDKAENEVKKMMEELQGLSAEFKDFRENSLRNSGSPDSQKEEVIKSFEAIVKHLEDQVNNRRSLWVMKHRDPKMIAQAIETMADSFPDKSVLTESLSSLRAAGLGNGNSGGQHHRNNGGESSAPPPRAQSTFQHLDRPPSAQSPPFSALQAWTPRAPSTRPQTRHFQGWGSSDVNGTPSRAASTGNAAALVSPPSYNRVPSRRGFQTQPRYRSNGPGFQPSMFAQQPPARPGTAFGGHGRDYYPNANGRSRHGSRPMQGSFDGSLSSVNGAMVPRNGFPGPLIHLTVESVQAWTRQISDFYRSIRNFVDMHASEPIDNSDHHLNETVIWPILVRTYLPLSEMEAASYLEFHLRDQNAKKCLVTRVIIDYVVNLVWVPGAWKGADMDSTFALAELERELIQTRGQPSSARQPLLDRQASILDAIMKQHDPSSDYYKGKTEEIAGTLLTNLQPLLDSHTAIRDAYVSLAAVAEQAWDLSSKILTSRLTFDFRFPEIGCRFSSQSMVNIWPAGVDASELQAKHWRVALVTTPVITCRIDTGSNISAHSVALADVICMQ